MDKINQNHIIKKIIKIVVPVIFGIGILIFLMGVKIILDWGKIAANYYEYGAEIVYAISGLIFFWLIVLPFLKVIFTKSTEKPTESWSYKKYKKYCKKMSKNRHLDDLELKYKLKLVKNTDEAMLAITEMENHLEKKVVKIINFYGKSAFISTAVSQNAKLDSISTIILNMRLVWEITNLYKIKPTLKDLWKIYIEVIATGFLSIGISEIPTEDLVEPLLQKITGGFIQNVPLGVVATNAISDSLFEGSANALLTLRIGIITKYYNGSTYFPKAVIRKRAFQEALNMITPIIKECTYDLSMGISKKMGSSLYSGVKKATKTVYENIYEKVNEIKTGINETTTKISSKIEKKNDI